MKAQMSLFDKLSVVLFAGGGGADTGLSCMTGRPVDIAVNHDIDAIRQHKTNHPYTWHLQEDVFAVDPAQVCAGRSVGILWASPDCTHFSKAKGGKPVKKEIRGLSWVLLKWALAVRPDVIFMENVEEIQTWGPCIETHRGLQPDAARKGETYQGFIGMLTTGIPLEHPALVEACEFLGISTDSPEAGRLVDGLGYDFGSQILCAADYGVPTIRKRWFAVFRCDGRPVRFPEPTHSKDGRGGLPRWRAAAEVIDWSLPCPSIFESKREIKDKYGLTVVRPLAVNTQKRCICGVDKFTIKSGSPFIVPTGYGERQGQAPRVHSIQAPVPTVVSTTKHNLCKPLLAPFGVTVNHQGDRFRGQPLNEPCGTITGRLGTEIVAPSFIQYHSEQGETVRGQAITAPVMTVDTANRYGLVSAQLTEYFGAGRPLDVAQPLHTVTGKDREALTTAQLAEFRGEDVGAGADSPLRAIASHDHQALTMAHIQKYFDGGYTGCGSDADAPLGTVTTQDHNALCLSHVVKFKGDNLGQHPAEPLQTITAESGGGSYGAVRTTVERYAPGADLKHWPKVRDLLNTYCNYTLSEDEILLLWIGGTAYYIADIGLRMLAPRELYNAMGFPPDYIIDRDYTGREYAKSAQVARCGNAVCPPVAGALVKANLAEYALPEYIQSLSDLWQAVGM